MPTSPEIATTIRRVGRARRAVAAAVGLAVGATALLSADPAPAQTVSTTVTSGLKIDIAVEAPPGADATRLPTGNIRVFFTITNAGPALTNQQAVIRVGRKPDEIASVSEGSDVRGIGLIDSASGAWYHTIPQIPAGGTVVLVLSMIKVCGGRWPIAARVGERLGSAVAVWRATSDSRCAPDETVNPAPASYYQLAWPATSGGSGTSGTTTTSIVPQGATVSTMVSTGSATTMPAAGGTPTTLLRLGGPNATTTTTSTTTTTLAGRAGVTTTTVILCKTVGGKRYCAPKSSVYREGQTKAVEISSRATRKKTTKKRR